MMDRDDKERLMNAAIFKVPLTNAELREAAPLIVWLGIVAALIGLTCWVLSK